MSTLESVYCPVCGNPVYRDSRGRILPHTTVGGHWRPPEICKASTWRRTK